MSRVWRRWLLLGAATVILVTACSPMARHRVASFLFDGVPPLETPGEKLAMAGEPEADESEPTGEQAEPSLRKYFAHTPYRENRCGGCHDATSGQLVRPLDEGLCKTCHGPFLQSRRYLHGPVAADACSFCHHYHTAPYPNLLLEAPRDLCLKCHMREDLTTGSHHADLDGQSCEQCHDAHGSADRFFLKQEGS